MKNWQAWLPQGAIVVGLGLWIYSPVFHGYWVWDDERYISQNSLIQDPLGFWKVWFSTDGLGDYYPLTSFVEWYLWHLFGDAMPGYHLTTLGLHLLSAFLLWRLLARFGLRLAWIGALFFTVHPIMVESVAWITELKNTLSLPPLLVAMLCWLDWKETENRRSYYLSLVCFAASVLAKISGMMLPFIFLGYSWWKRENIQWRDIRSLAPFFIVMLLAGLATLVPHYVAGDAVVVHTAWNLGAGLASMGWLMLFLLCKSVFPIGLLPIYPGFIPTSANLLDLVPWLALAGLFCLFWLKRNSWGRPVLFGLGFFMVNLVPLLGFTVWKYPTMVWTMNHNVYLPIMGLIGLAVAFLGLLERRLPLVLLYAERVLVMAVVLLMAWDSHGYAGWFVDNETLWTSTLKKAPDSWLAHQNLGVDLMGRQHFQEAFDQYTQVEKLHPGTNDGGINLAGALEKLGQTDTAGRRYRELIQSFPNDPRAYRSLGEMLNKAGNRGEAETLFRQGLQVAPRDATLDTDLAGVLLQTGRLPDAIDLYQQAVALSPELPQLQYNLGIAQLQVGNLPEAEEHLEQALALDPSLTAAHENLGVIMAQAGHLPEAIEQFEAVLQAKPNSPQTLDNLALALAQTGQITEAIEKFNKALELNPQDARARDSLAKLQHFEQQQGAPGKN